MRILGGLGLALLLASGCGDLDSRARALTQSQVCDEICGWPDECFAQFDVSPAGADCVQTCEAQAEIVGLACMSAVASTVECIGTCDVDSLTQDEADDVAAKCRDHLEAMSDAC